MSTPQQPVGASLVVLFDRDRRLLFEHPEAVGKAFSKEYAERELYPRAFFNDTANTEIYTLSLHDALPLWC